jgi:hypothetical protein
MTIIKFRSVDIPVPEGVEIDRPTVQWHLRSHDDYQNIVAALEVGEGYDVGEEQEIESYFLTRHVVIKDAADESRETRLILFAPLSEARIGVMCERVHELRLLAKTSGAARAEEIHAEIEKIEGAIRSAQVMREYNEDRTSSVVATVRS